MKNETLATVFNPTILVHAFVHHYLFTNLA